MRLWKKYGIKEIMMNEKGFFFFKFAKETTMLQCLEDGCWLLQNRPILLKKWQPQMELNKESPCTVPLWVKFYDVPLELWTHKGLSHIAIGVGKPLGMDRITEDTYRLGIGRVGYAQILFEVEACCKLPEVVTILMPYKENKVSKEMLVRVEYQWKPSQCIHCSVFGHGEAVCPKIARVEIQAIKEQQIYVRENENDGFQIVQCKG
ncbi:hypothetical protein Pint_08105 [Pistacia integerrima]|uniref:Uncharacterized protein n=1 Tax=Pistacia integerrima TaxID=434235 RepID=A0ACC0XTR3_9ROSI|nr:hypothetical protein Pint_08105 [Pistacia integerrima]